jgi:hypothetical protein
MSRIVKAAQIGSATCALALFIAPAAFAAQVITHVPTPEIHVPPPQIHVPTPQTPDASTRLRQIEDSGGGTPKVLGTKRGVQKAVGTGGGAANLGYSGTAGTGTSSDGTGVDPNDKNTPVQPIGTQKVLGTQGGVAKVFGTGSSAPNVIGSGSAAPSVTGDSTTGTTPSSSSQTSSQTVPGINNPGIGTSGVSSSPTGNTAGVSTLNVPGSQNDQQTSAAMQAIDGMGGPGSLNLPGSTNQQDPNIDAAAQLASEIAEQNQAMLNQAMQGGVNGLNIPTDSSPGVKESDGFWSNLWSSLTGSGGGSGGPSGGPGGSSAPGETSAATQGANVVNTGTPIISSTGTSTQNGATITAVTSTDGTTTSQTQTITTQAGNNYVSAGTYDPSKGTISGVIIGPIRGGKNNTPSDDDGGGPVSASTPLNPNSTVAKIGEGGGTNNNPETSSGQSSRIAPNAPIASKGYGDGTGDDAGDNNKVSKGGTLATGTTLTQKGNGDGGNSDGRGDAGTTSIMGKLKVDPGGGDPHQSTLSGTAATGQ